MMGHDSTIHIRKNNWKIVRCLKNFVSTRLLIWHLLKPNKGWRMLIPLGIEEDGVLYCFELSKGGARWFVEGWKLVPGLGTDGMKGELRSRRSDGKTLMWSVTNNWNKEIRPFGWSLKNSKGYLRSFLLEYWAHLEGLHIAVLLQTTCPCICTSYFGFVVGLSLPLVQESTGEEIPALLWLGEV